MFRTHRASGVGIRGIVPIALLVSSLLGSTGAAIPAWSLGPALPQGKAEDKLSARCAVSDADEFYIEGDGLSVFEAARNAALNGSPSEISAQKRYYWEPKFKVKTNAEGSAFRLSRIDDLRSKVSFAIEPTISSSDPVLRFIESKRNRFARSTNILPLCVFQLDVSHGMIDVPYSLPDRAGFALNNPILVEWTLETMRATALYNDLRGGGVITLSYQILVKHSVEQLFRLTGEELVEAQAYRDFISPADEVGSLIWVTHRDVARSLLAVEIAGYAYTELPESAIATEKLLSRLEHMVEKGFKEREVSFDELRANPQHKLVNFQDNRYAADLITELALDAKDLNDQQWCKKYSHNRSRSQSGGSTSDVEGDLSVALGKLTLGLFGSSKRTKNHTALVNDLLNQEDCGRSFIDKSVTYDQKGEAYRPKGIIAFERITTNDSFDFRHQFETYRSDQSFDSRYIQISINEDH